MTNPTTRRTFLGASISTLCLAGSSLLAQSPVAADYPLPVVDWHAHPDGFEIDQLLSIAKKRNVRIGLVEHAGTTENKYPVLLSNDEQLLGWINKLRGKGCYIGVQAEYIDWMTCFSKKAVAQLDFVLSDALTFRDRGGKRVHLWKKEEVNISDPQDFMDRYTDFNVEVIASEPIDILANPTFLPEVLEKQYDGLWTEKRMSRVIDAAAKHRVAIEINSRYQIPSLQFLKLAKAAGCIFSFGSNGRGEDIARVDHCLAMAKALDLKEKDLFSVQSGKKAVDRRWR